MSATEGGDLPTPNGDARPETSTIATPGKRKRSAQEENAGADAKSSTSRDQANLQENLRSLVDLLLK